MIDIHKIFPFTLCPISFCRVKHLLANLFQPLPSSVWANCKLAEVVEKMGKMVEHPKSKSTQPGAWFNWDKNTHENPHELPVKKLIGLIKSSCQHTVSAPLCNNYESAECHLLSKLNGSSTQGVDSNFNSTLRLHQWWMTSSGIM